VLNGKGKGKKRYFYTLDMSVGARAHPGARFVVSRFILRSWAEERSY